MTILLLANHLNSGGISSYLRTLSLGLIHAGHRVIVATSGGGLVLELEAAGVQHVRMDLRMKSEISPFLFFNLSGLLKILKNEKVDVMHAQTRVTAMLAAIASKLSGVPYVTTCHGYFNAHLGRRIMPLWGRRTIAISRPVIEHLTRDLGVAKERVELIPNGIDLDLFRVAAAGECQSLRAKWSITNGPVIGTVARLSDVKGHVHLIDAMVEIRKAIPGVQCLILGEGPMEKILRDKVAALGLDGVVRFSPVVNQTAEVMGLFDVFVVPSLSEGLGLSAMEAMASGLPVVASSVGGLLDLIKDGETGLLVPPKDPSALAGAVVKLLQDPDKGRAMGAAARAFIAKHFSKAAMVDGTIRLYQSALGQVK